MKRVENVEQMEVDQGMRKKLKTQESEKKFVRSCASCSRVPCEGRRIMASALWKLRDLTADVQVYANDKSMTLVHCSILDSQLPRLVAQSFGGRKRLRRFDLDLPKNVVVDWLRAAYWMRDIDDGPTRDTMITLAKLQIWLGAGVTGAPAVRRGFSLWVTDCLPVQHGSPFWVTRSGRSSSW